MASEHVLLVEDDARLAQLVCEYLQQHDFVVQWESRGDTALENFREETQLVILDLMIPGVDGLGVCKSLREHYDGPILMLTAKGSDIDQVLGLELGADDYVVKPVEPRVLLARLRALLRRYDARKTAVEPARFGALSVHPGAQKAELDGAVLPLTTQEFDLLHLLSSRAGEVLSRGELYQHLRGLEYDGLDRSVDVCISHLRKKLGDDGDRPRMIKTVWGKGYLFVADER